MKNRRVGFTDNEHILLSDQFQGQCPLCFKSLIYKKSQRFWKNYELAHIYPLNPTMFEEDLLQGVRRLSTDVNDLDNIIPLCTDCHTRFDKPRTVEDYELVLRLKEEAIKAQNARKRWYESPVENDVASLINSLAFLVPSMSPVDLQYDPKTVDDKLNSTMSPISQRQIKGDVSEYFHTVRQELKNLDSSNRNNSEMLAMQFRHFYLSIRDEFDSQQKIFDEMVKWIHVSGKSPSYDASRILTSFFVQNCEVFE